MAKLDLLIFISFILLLPLQAHGGNGGREGHKPLHPPKIATSVSASKSSPSAQERAFALLEKAIETIDTISDPSDRLHAAKWLIRLSFQKGELALLPRLLIIAQQTFAEMRNFSKDIAAADFSYILIIAGHERDAMRLADQYPKHQDLIFRDISDALSMRGEYGRAKEVAALINGAWARSQAHESMANNRVNRLAERGDFKAALLISRKAAVKIVGIMVERGEFQRAFQLLDEEGIFGFTLASAHIDISRAQLKAGDVAGSERTMALA